MLRGVASRPLVVALCFEACKLCVIFSSLWKVRGLCSCLQSPQFWDQSPRIGLGLFYAWGQVFSWTNVSILTACLSTCRLPSCSSRIGPVTCGFLAKGNLRLIASYISVAWHHKWTVKYIASILWMDLLDPPRSILLALIFSLHHRVY